MKGSDKRGQDHRCLVQHENALYESKLTARLTLASPSINLPKLRSLLKPLLFISLPLLINDPSSHHPNLQPISPLSVRLRDRVNSRRLPSFLASIFGRRRGDGGSSFFQSTSINLDFRAAVYQPPRRSSPAFLFSTPSSSTDVFLSSFLSFFLFFAFVSSRACTTDFLGRLERRIIIHQGLCLILAR